MEVATKENWSPRRGRRKKGENARVESSELRLAQEERRSKLSSSRKETCNFDEERFFKGGRRSDSRSYVLSQRTHGEKEEEQLSLEQSERVKFRSKNLASPRNSSRLQTAM